MIKAVVFDLDDTIVNSEPLHRLAWAQLLQEYNYKITDIPQEMQESQMGMRISDVIKERASYLNLKDDLETISKKRSKIFLRLVKEKLEVIPGLFPVLSSLRKDKYRLAIATSGSRNYVDLVMVKFNLGKSFEFIVTGDDVKKSKPDPEIYLKTAEMLGLHPNECLVIEDAGKGVLSAKSAGCKCIAIKTPFTREKDLLKADLLLESLDQLQSGIIKKLSS